MSTIRHNWDTAVPPLFPPEHSAWERRVHGATERARRAFEAVLIDGAYLLGYFFETVDRAAVPATATLDHINPWGRHARFARWVLLWAMASAVLLY